MAQYVSSSNSRTSRHDDETAAWSVNSGLKVTDRLCLLMQRPAPPFAISNAVRGAWLSTDTQASGYGSRTSLSDHGKVSRPRSRVRWWYQRARAWVPADQQVAAAVHPARAWTITSCGAGSKGDRRPPIQETAAPIQEIDGEGSA